MSSEKEIEKSILRYLDLKGWFVWKNPCIGRYDTKRKQFIKPRSPYMITGVADIIAVGEINHVPVTLFVEVKTPKGRQTPNQKDFEDQIRIKGGLYYVVRSIEDVDLMLRDVNDRTIKITQFFDTGDTHTADKV